MKKSLISTITLALMAFLPLCAQTSMPAGADFMPPTVAPIEAPFPMPQLQRPEFGTREVRIKLKTKMTCKQTTAAIQKAIEKMNKAGGGTVTVPAGEWTVGRIILLSGVCLNVEKGAVLNFSGDLEDYLPAVFTRSAGVEGMGTGSCIYAYKQHHIGITGQGRLVGPPKGTEIRKRQLGYGSFDRYVDYDAPPTERFYDGRDGKGVFSPTFIGPVECTDVLIEGLTLENSIFWNIVPTYCDSVIIRGMRVKSTGTLMGDGMDIESSRNVLIEYNTLENGDDCYTFKAGRGIDGLKVGRPTENIVLRYNLALAGHGGIAVGSETAGMIRNLYAHDCVFKHVRFGIRFKTRRPRGGGGEKLYYERIQLDSCANAITIDMLGSASVVGNLATSEALPINEFTPVFRDIHIKDVEASAAGNFLSFTGLPERNATGIVLENVHGDAAHFGKVSGIDGLSLIGCDIRCGDAAGVGEQKP